MPQKQILIFNNKKFHRVNISFALHKKHFYFDYYVFINKEKLVRYTSNLNNNYEELLKLQNKNVSYIYLDEVEFKRYLNYSVEEDKYPNGKSITSCLDNFLENKELISEFYLSCGLDELRIKMLLNNYNKSLKIIKEDKILEKLLNDYTLRNRKDFLKKELLNLLTTYILSKYEVISKENLIKVNSAIIIEDLLLNNEEIELSQSEPIHNDKTKNHMKEIIGYLPKNSFFQSDIIINLLKYHHEKPDGTGYPFKIKHFHFDIFLSVRYISEVFLNKIIEKDLKVGEVDSILDEINLEFKKYNSENFKKALKLLNYSMGRTDSHE